MNYQPIVSRRRTPLRAQLGATFLLSALVLAASLPGAVVAEVRVDEPWVRATVAGQQASGAFMTLTSSKDARLVAVETPVAGVSEIHEMALEDNVMRMRPIDGLALPAGTPVELRPGGYHLMLLELKGPLNTGENVGLTLTVEDAGGRRERIEVQAPVRPLTAGHGHGAKMHGH